MAKNLIILEGDVLHEPPLRATRSGTSVTNFKLQVPEEELEDSFSICITVFGRLAEEVATRLRVGCTVRVQGRLSRSKTTGEQEIVAREICTVA